MCVYLWQCSFACVYVWDCVSVHACLFACDGDGVKGFTLHFSLCVYPFGGPLLQGRGFLSFFFLHSNASYRLCKTPLNAEKIGRVVWVSDRRLCSSAFFSLGSYLLAFFQLWETENHYIWKCSVEREPPHLTVCYRHANPTARFSSNLIINYGYRRRKGHHGRHFRNVISVYLIFTLLKQKSDVLRLGLYFYCGLYVHGLIIKKSECIQNISN